jgi:hypothetical protein
MRKNLPRVFIPGISGLHYYASPAPKNKLLIEQQAHKAIEELRNWSPFVTAPITPVASINDLKHLELHCIA